MKQLFNYIARVAFRSFQDARQIKLRWQPESFEEKSNALRKLLSEETSLKSLTVYDLKGTRLEAIEPKNVSVRELEAELCRIRLVSHPNDPDALFRLGCCFEMGVVIEAKDLRNTKFEGENRFFVNRTALAAELYRLALRANPQHSQAMLALSYCIMEGSDIKLERPDLRDTTFEDGSTSFLDGLNTSKHPLRNAFAIELEKRAMKLKSNVQDPSKSGLNLFLLHIIPKSKHEKSIEKQRQLHYEQELRRRHRSRSK